MLAFDEAHAAKHARSTSGSSRAGETVLALERTLPLARVMYASATAATEICHMGYLERCKHNLTFPVLPPLTLSQPQY